MKLLLCCLCLFSQAFGAVIPDGLAPQFNTDFNMDKTDNGAFIKGGFGVTDGSGAFILSVVAVAGAILIADLVFGIKILPDLSTLISSDNFLGEVKKASRSIKMEDLDELTSAIVSAIDAYEWLNEVR